MESTDSMPKITDLNWFGWLYGLLAGFIGGGAGAIAAGVAVTIIDPQNLGPTTSKFWTLILVVFLSNGVLNAAAYLKQSPLPAVNSAGADGPK